MNLEDGNCQTESATFDELYPTGRGGGGEGEQGVSLVSRLMNQRQLDAAVAAAKDEAEGGSLSNEAWGGGSS